MLKYLRIFLCFLFTFSILLINSADSEANTPRMISPMNGPITSDFGKRTHPITGEQGKGHSGVDIGGVEGQPIVAAAAGYVIHSGWISGYGLTIIIDHGGGITTLYGHNSKLCVEVGQQVSQGYKIAECGSTGNSTGPHCHFEVRENGEPVSPWGYCPVIGDGSYVAGGSDLDGINMNFDADYNYGKYIMGDDGIIKPIIDAARKGISTLRQYLIAIVVTLMTIDLALGSMFKTIDSNESGGKIIKWIIAKFIWFGLLLYLMEEWGTIFGNTVKEFFIGAGSKMAGVSEETVISAFTDPTIILQKGYHLIVPIFTELHSVHISTWSFMKMFAGMAVDTALPTIFLEIIAFAVLLVVYSCMTYQILFAYIEFHLVVLFSFVSFIFAGTKYTRHFAANGLNGLFAAFISLMFFCFFSVIVQTSMEHITVDAMFEVEQRGKTTVMYGNGDNIRDVKDFMARTKQVESSGDYTVYNSEGSGAYGAYQHMPEYWEGRCISYVNAGGTLCLRDDDNPPNAPPGSYTYSWCPENQDKVTEFCMQNLYNDKGSWRAVAAAWYGADSDEYWGKICNAKPGGMSKKVVNIIVILKLVLISVLLLFFGSRLHKLIIEQFGSMGFKFTNE